MGLLNPSSQESVIPKETTENNNKQLKVVILLLNTAQKTMTNLFGFKLTNAKLS